MTDNFNMAMLNDLIEVLKPPRVITSAFLTVPSKRVPRSKRRRIREKWSKRHARIPDPNFYLVNYYPGAGNMCVCHPAMKAELDRQMKQSQPKQGRKTT